MGELKKLYRESSHYFGARFGLMLLGFVSFPLFTRVFSVSEYGIMSLVLNTLMVLTALSKLGMQNAVQRFYPDYADSSDPSAFQRYYSTLFLGAGLTSGLCMVLYVGTVYLLPSSVVRPSLRSLLVFSSLLIVVRTLRSMQGNLWQVERKTVVWNTSEIVNKAGVIGSVILLLVLWQRGLNSLFLGTIVFEAIVVLAFVPSLLKRHLLSIQAFDSKFFRTSIAFSVPLMWAELAWMALDTGDRYLIEHFLGLQAVGYYAAAYGVANHVQDLVTVPLSFALFPICLKIWSTKGEQETAAFLSQSLERFVLGATCIVCTFTVVSRDLIILLASQKYADAHRLLPWLVCGLVISGGQVFLKPGLLIHKKVFKFLSVTAYAALINIGLNVLLLPRMGVQAAAIATLASYAAWVAMMAKESLAVLPFRINLRAVLRYLAVGAATVLLVSRLQIETPLLSVLIKGTTTVVAFLAILWAIDKQFRDLVRSACRWAVLSRRHNAEATAPVVVETVSVGEQNN
jgi:O-antigen/teichoic acid export membrane protein